MLFSVLRRNINSSKLVRFYHSEITKHHKNKINIGIGHINFLCVKHHSSILAGDFTEDYKNKKIVPEEDLYWKNLRTPIKNLDENVIERRKNSIFEDDHKYPDHED